MNRSSGGIVLTGQTTEWQRQLDEWVQMYKSVTNEGMLASYIPALEQADLNALGVYLVSEDGTHLYSGDYDVPFTLQSVSKVINFLAACETQGFEYILEKVDVEPTGDAFDSIIRLEAHKPGKPFNPMINAGAITVASMLPGKSVAEKSDAFNSLLEQVIGRKPSVNLDVYESEMAHGDRNRALAYYLKGLGYLDADVHTSLEVYTRQCAVEVTAQEVAQIGLMLACDGLDVRTGQQVVSKRIARIAKSLMVTCGTYNASGKMAAFVGLPTKSGVSGAILTSVPARIGNAEKPFVGASGIGIYGPALDTFGNSLAGIELLKQISSAWDLSIW